MRDAYLRLLFASCNAYVAAGLVFGALGLLAPSSALNAGGAGVPAAYTAAIALPFLVVDAVVVRPALWERVALPLVFAIEVALLLAYRFTIQWRGIADGTAAQFGMLARRVGTEAVAFAAIYFALTVLLLRLLGRHANPAACGPCGR